ncbi:MAG: glycerophosphodiester phosphodiesterase [Terriglobales bacterium]
MPRPLLLGHRGARAARHIPENTLASFELSLQHGCDGFEFDVRRSGDGQAVVCHDPVVRGMEVAKTRAADLGLPTLSEVLRSFSGRAFLDIELKVDGLEQQTIALLREHPPQKGYVVSSFLSEVLVTLHDLDASIPLGFLCETPDELDRWRALPVSCVIPQFGLADQALIRQVHEAEKAIMVWTVNEADEMRKLAEWGADAIISDETELAVNVLS